MDDQPNTLCRLQDVLTAHGVTHHELDIASDVGSRLPPRHRPHAPSPLLQHTGDLAADTPIHAQNQRQWPIILC